MTEMDELIPDATPLATPRKGLRQWELTPEMLSRLDALAEEYGLIAQPEQPQSIEPEGGFAASAKRAAGAGIKGAGQAAADFIPGVDQDNALKKYGQSVIDANPTAVNSPEDIADKPGQGCNRSHGKCRLINGPLRRWLLLPDKLCHGLDPPPLLRCLHSAVSGISRFLLIQTIRNRRKRRLFYCRSCCCE